MQNGYSCVEINVEKKAKRKHQEIVTGKQFKSINTGKEEGGRGVGGEKWEGGHANHRGDTKPCV